MKNLLFALLLLSAFTSCEKSNCGKSDKGDNTVYRGRIINSICASTTVQVFDAPTLGEMGWKGADFGGTTIYNNVFAVSNHCTAGVSGLAAGDTFSFRFVPATPQDCITCLALGNTPSVAYNIQLVP